MRSLSPKVGWMLSGILALYVLSALAGVVTGGPLDPPGAPSPSMLRLDELPPSWSRLLSADGADPCDTTRFDCVLDDAAVLDRETGLVWERDGSRAFAQWPAAVEACVQHTIGGRRGWRLPTADELLSLAIPFAPGPDLPPLNSPFTGFSDVSAEPYWTATSSTQDPAFVFVVDPAFGFASTHPKAGSSDHAERVVCVRGGQSSQNP